MAARRNPRLVLARELRSENVRETIPEAVTLQTGRVPWSGERREDQERYFTPKGQILTTTIVPRIQRGIVCLRRPWSLYGVGIAFGQALHNATLGAVLITVSSYLLGTKSRYQLDSTTFDPATEAVSNTLVLEGNAGGRVEVDVSIVQQIGFGATDYDDVLCAIWGYNSFT